ncbi:MAG TPA: BBP7 family outer membrane beta-barrel protein [Thermoguttaceae bacterium]|nr:BBP7 family outer membrane beta-barrel protein [Thermoguttaceae bacterium]
MRLLRSAALVTLTAMLAPSPQAQLAQAQSGYYGPLESFPSYGAYALTPGSRPMPTRPDFQGTPTPVANGPAYAQQMPPAFPAIAATANRYDADPRMPLPPSPASYGHNENAGSPGRLMETMLAEASVDDEVVIEPLQQPTVPQPPAASPSEAPSPATLPPVAPPTAVSPPATSAPASPTAVAPPLDAPQRSPNDFVYQSETPVPEAYQPEPYASDEYEETACRACGQYLPGCCSPWYMSMSTVVLGRNKPNKLWTSYETGAPSNLLRNTHDMGFEWQWGNEIRFGRRFGGDQWALEVGYWTLYPMEGDIRTTHASSVSSTLDVADVEFNAISGTEWFDNALRHRLQRRDEVHNVELNLIRFSSMVATAEDPWSADWSMGLRYFRFQEQLIFSSDADNTRAVFVGDPTLDTTALLNDRVTNSLFGFQLGCDLDYRLFSRLRFFANPRIGIYNNRIKHEFQAYLSDATVATPSAASGQTGTYPVESSVDAFSFITQLDMGFELQVAPNWTAQGGYRMMVATGMGLSDHQIPDAVVNIDELADIDRNGELILHGAYFNVIYDY